MKLFENSCTLAYPWDIATLAFWRKYPDPRVMHVKEVDTLHRSINPATGELTTYRLIACETALPGWVAALAGTNRAYTLEQSISNPRTKTMVVRSRNLTGASMLLINETCIYQQDPKNPTCTQYRQIAEIKANMLGVRSALESFCHSDMVKKSQTGIKVVEELCQKLTKDGVQSLFDHLTSRPKLVYSLAGPQAESAAQ
jgi:hypothetical protein